MQESVGEVLVELRMQKQTAVVTGAGRGIGRAIALMLGRAGAHVVLTARTEPEIGEVRDEIRAAGGQATAIPADVSDEDRVTALFEDVRKGFGGLDVLVNNAGTGIFGPLVSTETPDFDRIMSVNVRGTFLCCREAMKAMMSAGRGTIINISSVVGFRGYPDQSAYSASKHGVMGLTKSLAVEAQAHGIRVSAVLPGGVDTPMAGDSRPDLDREELLHPDDVAEAVGYLLSLSERAAVDEIYIRRRTSRPF